MPGGFERDASSSGVSASVATSLPASAPVPAPSVAVPIVCAPILKVTLVAGASPPAEAGEMVALNVTLSLYCWEFGVTERAVVVDSWTTLKPTVLELMGPAMEARRVTEPRLCPVTDSVAMPELAFTCPKESAKSTEPVPPVWENVTDPE